MSEIFRGQAEAVAYVRAISDQVERTLTDAALNRAMSFLLGDADYKKQFAASPFDLLLFARTTHAFFRRKDVLADILSGKVQSVEDLSPFPMP
jgi:hypothetical protein